MFEQTLAKEVFFLLNLRGQSLHASTLSSKLRALLCLILEGSMGILLTMETLFSADDLYAVLENLTALITLLQVL